MANGNLIEPTSPAPAAVEIEPTEPQAASAPEQGQELPEEILRIPAFGPLLAGEPSAFSANINALDKMPEGKIILKNAEILQQSGINFYRALDKETGVVFNALRLPAETLRQADEAGQLKQIAPDFSVLNDTAARSGNLNPVLTAEAPVGPPIPAAPTPPQQSSGLLNPPPASLQTSLSKSRTKNLQPGSPTSGPAPGRGRLLNNLLKPAI